MDDIEKELFLNRDDIEAVFEAYREHMKKLAFIPFCSVINTIIDSWCEDHDMDADEMSGKLAMLRHTLNSAIGGIGK